MALAEPLPRPVVEWLMSTDDHELPTLADFLARPAWMDRAACRGVGPEPFLTRSVRVRRGALALCAGCVVRPQCLDFALAHDELQGVWGGLTQNQRRKLGQRRS